MADCRQGLKEVFGAHADSDPDDRMLIEGIASALYEYIENEPDIDRWPQSARCFYALYDMDFQIGNGGLAQAAYNIPELFPAVIDAYETLGRPLVAQFFREALGLLPAELQEHLDKDLRDDPSIGDVFEYFNESAMAEFEEKAPEELFVDDLLHSYALEHRAVFEAMDSV